MTATLTQIAAAFRQGDWSAVRRAFSGRAAATELTDAMQTWRQAHVTGLRVLPVYSRKLGPGRYVETLEFWADQRAVPWFEIYSVQVRGGHARITGMVTGLRGTTYRDTNWSATRSPHFVFYHSPYQLAGTDRSFIADLEYERAQFQRKFGVSLSPLIHYYLYPRQQLMNQLTRNTPLACGTLRENVGCANPYTTPPTVQASFWPTYHEPIHVYELALEPRAKPHSRFVYVAPLFISEGTAVALEDKELDPALSDYCSDQYFVAYAPLDDCGRIALAHVKPVTLLPDTGFNSVDGGYAYSLAGSFVKYLIVRFGYHSFGKFYYQLAAQPKDRLQDYNVASQAVYHQPITSLLDAFSRSLCPGGC